MELSADSETCEYLCHCSDEDEEGSRKVDNEKHDCVLFVLRLLSLRVSIGPFLNQVASVHLTKYEDQDDEVDDKDGADAASVLEIVFVALELYFDDLVLLVSHDPASLFGSIFFHDHIFGLRLFVKSVAMSILSTLITIRVRVGSSINSLLAFLLSFV